MPAAAIASVAISAYGAYSGAQAQKKAAKQQQGAIDSQTQVAKDQLDFSKSQYSDWKNAFYPAINQLGAESQKEILPDYSGIAANVGNAFDTSQGINDRNMERFGVKPTDGSFQSSQTQYGLGRALATVGADQAARTEANNQRYARMAGFAGMGMGQQGALLNAVNSGTGNLMSAFGNAANMYGGRAQQYGQSAMAGAGMFGRGLSSLFSSFGGSGGGGSSDGNYNMFSGATAGGSVSG